MDLFAELDRPHRPEPKKIGSMEELGRLIAARRKARKYTQQEFADLAGVGKRFVVELEGGKQTAEIGKVLQVLNALGLDLLVKNR
jgi:HTH-type transcriptional regulator / antitoxin HipB